MSHTIRVADRAIGAGCPTYVIAEIGINHDGDEALARDLITAAAETGADAAKFQTVDVSESYAVGTPSYAEFSSRILPPGALERLASHARDKNIHLFTTPADLASLAIAAAAELPAIKISSGLLTHVPLIRAACKLGKPLLLSTGLATLDEVRLAVETARDAGAAEVGLFQCTSIYPASASMLNLRAMETMRDAFDCPVGYSDHHDGDLASIAAVAMGASMIEKHFTLDCTRRGADHHISLEPEAFTRMVTAIRQVEAMSGSGIKAPIAAEKAAMPRIRRVLIARNRLEVGHVLRESDFRFMRIAEDRPAISTALWDSVNGRSLIRGLEAGAVVSPDDVGL